jgi:hypothetical protein
MSDDEKYLDPKQNPMIKANGDLDGVETDGLAPMKIWAGPEILEQKLQRTSANVIDVGDFKITRMADDSWRVSDGRGLGSLKEEEIQKALEILEEGE